VYGECNDWCPEGFVGHMEDTGECAPVLNAEDFDSLDDAKHSACMMTFGEA
jgi:hypothetical protein